MTSATVAPFSALKEKEAGKELSFDDELTRLLAPITEYFSEGSAPIGSGESDELQKAIEQRPSTASGAVSFGIPYQDSSRGWSKTEVGNGLSCSSKNEIQNPDFLAKWESMKQILKNGHTTLKTLSVVGESMQFLFNVLQSVEENVPLLSGTIESTPTLEHNSNSSFMVKLQDAEADRLSNCLSKLQKLYMEFDHTTLDLRSSSFASMVQELHDTCGALRTFPLSQSLRQEHYRKAVLCLEKVYHLLRNGVQAAMLDAERAVFTAAVLQGAAEKLRDVFYSTSEDDLLSSPETTAKHLEGWTNVFSYINHLYLDKLDESAPLRRYLELVGDDLREFGRESSSATTTGALLSTSSKEAVTLRPLFHLYIRQRSKLLKLLLRWWLYQVQEGENEKMLDSLAGYLERSSSSLEEDGTMSDSMRMPADLEAATSPSSSTSAGFCSAAPLLSFIEESAVALEAFMKLEKEVADRVWIRHEFQLAVLPPLNAALADSSYSVFRSRLLSEDDVQELSKAVEKIEAMRTYCSKKRWLELSDLWTRMMQDCQERLIFRASIYLRQDLAWNAPTKEWGSKYRAIREEYAKHGSEGGTSLPSAATGTERHGNAEKNTVQGEMESVKDGSTSVDPGAVSLAVASSSFEYIPMFPLAINLLRSLHGSLTSDIFSVLAEECIRLCLTQVKQLSRLMHSIGPPDEELLALLVEIAHLHYLHHYVSLMDAKITVVEKKIDLSQSLRYRKIKISESSRESMESVENQFAACYQKLVEVMRNSVSLEGRNAGKTEEDKRMASAKMQRLTNFYEYLLLRFVPDQWLRAKILLPVYQSVESSK